MPYRALYEALLGREVEDAYRGVLLPWLENNTEETVWLRGFAARRGQPIPPASADDLWRLYALQRVGELLLLGFQQQVLGLGNWSGPKVSLAVYESFFARLGISSVCPGTFHPFHHEIVEVLPAKQAHEPARLLEYRWPCMMLGSMIFLRGGVAVSAGRHTMHPVSASSSTLYWAYRRSYRPVNDLSQGWGSNSQWRTALRRDYLLGDKLYFNVDGRRDLLHDAGRRPESDGLSRAQRIELLVHRCLVSASFEEDGDFFPYDDTICLPR